MKVMPFLKPGEEGKFPTVEGSQEIILNNMEKAKGRVSIEVHWNKKEVDLGPEQFLKYFTPDKCWKFEGIIKNIGKSRIRYDIIT